MKTPGGRSRLASDSTSRRVAGPREVRILRFRAAVQRPAATFSPAR